MNKVTGVCLLIAIVIVTILLVIFIPKPKCYFDIEEYPQIKNIESYIINIDIPDMGKDQKVIPLYHNKYTNHINSNKYFDTYEEICEWVRCIPDVVAVTLIMIPPKHKTDRCQGCVHLANDTIRCVFPLEVPNSKKAGIWVDGESKKFGDNCIIYDNSRVHEIYNKHKRKRLVLLAVDIVRNDKEPKGVSKKETYDYI